MPAQDGVGGHNRCDLGKQTAAVDLAFGSEAVALIVGESEALLTEPLLQHSVFLNQVVNHLGLMSIGPPSEGGEEELEWEETGHDNVIVLLGRKVAS